MGSHAGCVSGTYQVFGAPRVRVELLLLGIRRGLKLGTVMVSHNAVFIPLDTEIARFAEAFDVLFTYHVLLQDRFPAGHFVKMFEVHGNCRAITLVNIVLHLVLLHLETIVAKTPSGCVTFTTNSMNVINCEELLCSHGRRESTEHLVYDVMGVTNGKEADLHTFETSSINQ